MAKNKVTQAASASAPISDVSAAAASTPAGVQQVNVALLASIANGMLQAPFYINAPAAELHDLGDLVEVNADQSFAVEGAPAVRLSEKGKAYLVEHPVVNTQQFGNVATPFGSAPENKEPAQQSHAAGEGAEVAHKTASAAHAASFKIVKNFEMPAVVRIGGTGGGGARPEKYPFSQLEKGDAFFVPVSADLPEPHKTLASTVASANDRYATELKDLPMVEQTRGRGVGKMVYQKEYSRKFAVRKAMGDNFGFPGVSGAVIGRII